MGGRKAVKPDPAVWLPLLDDFRLTSLPNDTVLEGRLRADLHASSSEVVDALAEWPAAAYLQSEDDQTHVVLVYQVKAEVPDSRWVHVVLLLATLLTTLGSGALLAGLDPFRTRVVELGEMSVPYPTGIQWDALWLGASFAFPFLGVLMAHEMGHWMAAKAHRVRASLPYFIPFPPYFSVIGTIGAFIRLRGPIVRRSILFDIGSSGPFASFIVSLPVLVLGLSLSDVVPGRTDPVSPFVVFFLDQPVWLGNGLLTHLLASAFGPGPVGEAPIHLHPFALVGWLGLFVTTLNLLPLGQLDGGHVLYALNPRRQDRVARLFLLSLVPLGLLWWGWWAWAVVVLFLHRGRVTHPRVVQADPELDPLRRLLAWSLIVTFLLTFVPVPIQL
jgi:membrane-associated protease RseP (regulator of RpoE activity)